jgi:L-threonylcarbamoyladenylate synthase
VQRIFAAKGRPSNDPIIVHVSGFDRVRAIAARVPDAAARLAARFWPGALTMVLPRGPAVPDVVTAGLDSVGVRVPAHPVARALLAAADLPIAAPSANLFSRPSPTRAAHVLDDLAGRVDIVLDGGATDVGIESTVLDLTGDVPTVLRPGAVSVEALREIVPDVRVRTVTQAMGERAAMNAPGLLVQHYSPRAPLTLYEGDRDRALARMDADARAARASGRTVGVLDFSREDEAEVAATLYDRLRDLDARGVAVAIRDRLRRAAAGRVVRA